MRSRHDILIAFILTMRTKLFISFFGAALILTGLGCGTTAGPNGGIFRSTDGGVTWSAKSTLASATAPASFATLDINTLAVDPQDARSLWAGTMTAGILYTFDSGESWLSAKNFAPAELQLTQSRVNGIAVDPANSCLVYATITSPNGKSYIIRTLTCGRSWGLLYTNEKTDEQLQTIAINPANHLQIFVGSSTGNVFRSENGGGSWVNVKNFNGVGVRTIVFNPSIQNELWAGTRQGGLWKSTDAGANWLPMDLKKFDGAKDVYSIAFDTTKNSTLLVGSRYGIVRTDDGGASWEALPLLTAPKETQILSIAINPKNSKRIFYGTPKAFYRSEDGGQTWTTKRVPTTRSVKNLLVTLATVGGVDTETLWIGAWQAAQ